MGRVILLGCVFIIIGPFGFSQAPNLSNYELFLAHYEVLARFGLPVEASAGEKAIQDYLTNLANELGFSVTRYAIQKQGSYHSFSQNIRITIPGKSLDSSALIVPITMPDNESMETYDPFLNPAFVATFMEKIKQEEIPLTITIEILGAENGRRTGLGTQKLIDDSSIKQKKAVLYLSWFDSREFWRPSFGAQGSVTPYWLTELFLDSLESSSVPLTWSVLEAQLHRFGMGPLNHLGAYLAESIPTVELRPDLNTARIDKKYLLEPLLKWVMIFAGPRLAETMTSGIELSDENNYLLIPLENDHFSLSEIYIVLSLFVGAAITFIIMAYRRRALRRYVRAMLKGFFSAVMLNAITGILVITSTGILSLLFTAGEISNLEPGYRLVLFIGKLCIALGFFFGINIFIKRVLPQNASFYTANAFFWGFCSLIIIIAANITISVYTSLALSFMGIGIVLRKLPLKIAAGILSLASMVWPAVEALRAYPSSPFASEITLSGLTTDIVLTMLLLPFLYYLLRIIYRNRPQYGLSPIAVNICTAAFFLSGIALIVIAGFNTTEIKENAIAVTLHRAVHSDEGNLLTDTSEIEMIDTPTNRITSLHIGDISIPTDSTTGSRIIRDILVSLPKSLSLTASSRNFLARKTINIGITSFENIISIDLNLKFDNPTVIYSLTFPYRYIDSQQIQVLIGKYPPLPINISITVPQEASGEFTLNTKSFSNVEGETVSGGKIDLRMLTEHSEIIRWNSL